MTRDALLCDSRHRHVHRLEHLSGKRNDVLIVFELQFVAIAELPEKTRDVLLLLGCEFALAAVIAIVCAIAAEVLNDLSAQSVQVFLLHFLEKQLKAVGCTDDLDFLEVWAVAVLVSHRIDGWSPSEVVGCILAYEEVQAFIVPRTSVAETKVPRWRYNAKIEGL